MGTDSGFYDDQMMRHGRCPHCFLAVCFEYATPLYGRGEAHVTFDIDEPTPSGRGDGLRRSFAFFQCPSCHDIIVWMRRSTCEADRVFLRVYPSRSNHAPAPAEVPAPIARAYEEACAVQPFSPSAAAALARRALQMTLREVVGVKHGTLNVEIDAARTSLPGWIIEGLHHLRQMGNFALHPSKDALTGELLEPEPGEADLTIELVSALFQHLFAGMEAAARLAAALAGRKGSP